MRVNQFDPFLTEEDIASLLEVIKSNWFTEGPKTKELESILQERCGVKRAILMPNGTLALFVALKALGIGPGDEVLVPDFTMAASATSVVLAGARPVFVEVGEDDFMMDPNRVEEVISLHTKAMMPVHLYGESVDIAPLIEIARRHNLKVVEDAAQGIGVTYRGQHVGTFGDIGCLSFFADKTITTGEGGAILTNNDGIAEEMQYIKNQGRLERGSFVHPKVGYNFRLTDLQAALAVSQMRRLDSIIEKKLHNEGLYRNYLTGIPQVSFPKPTGRGQRVPFRVNIMVPNPEALQKRLTNREIGTRRWFYPLHKQPCFTPDNSAQAPNLKNAEKIFEHGLSLPSGLGLKEEEIKYVCDAIREFYA